MSYASLRAEAEAIGAKIRNIVEHIRNATLAELHAIEEHLGLAHPEIHPLTTTFHDFDNRLGVIVNELHNTEPEKLDAVAAIVAKPGIEAAPENVVPLTPEVNETTQAPADTTAENGAASSGASAEAANPDQPVS